MTSEEWDKVKRRATCMMYVHKYTTCDFCIIFEAPWGKIHFYAHQTNTQIQVGKQCQQKQKAQKKFRQ